ncbi:MAG: cytochrome c biogenesis protein CcdA [Alphaproteobacteria bacterium]|nr:cytochrome c biogenesis protein CcdA [Alphaproteobacteria bacterium]
MLDIVLAFAAGLLTVGSPCVLPMLPIVLGATVGRSDPARPLFIILGFTVTFALVAFVFGLFPSVLGLSQETLRTTAVGLLLLFGALMIWPRLYELVTVRIGSVFGSVNRIGDPARSGKFGAAILGASLGAVWAPCAGPVLGSILTLIASAERLDRAAAMLGFYSLGAAVPMFAIAYGGQYASTHVRHIARYARPLQQGFGLVVILIAVAIFYQFDSVATVWLSNFYPDTLVTGL